MTALVLNRFKADEAIKNVAVKEIWFIFIVPEVLN